MAAAGNTLSESASKALLREYGVPMADEREVATAAEAAAAAGELGFPVVAKLCGDAIAHKTERGLVRLRLGDAGAVEQAAADLLAAATPADGPVSVLVAPMVSGNRELIAGVVRDPQFGANVMLGVGGILAEAIADVARWEGFDLAQCYAYSDSASDLPMMEAVGHPVAVNPDSKLERIAHRRGWPIVIFSRRTKAVVRRTSQGVGATSLAIGSFVVGVKYASRRPTD
jgi:hypothetical protein